MSPLHELLEERKPLWTNLAFRAQALLARASLA
jgi:hypothetical protein